MGLKLTTSEFVCVFKLAINGCNISAIVLAGNLFVLFVNLTIM